VLRTPGAREDELIKLDIINEVVSRTGITKTKAEMAVETVFESMKRALEHGDRIELRGFGVFNVKPRKTGIGRNPRTGAEVSIPPGKAVRFKPGKELQTLQYRCGGIRDCVPTGFFCRAASVLSGRRKRRQRTLFIPAHA
jgi:DNA-binding protein HU-beta